MKELTFPATLGDKQVVAKAVFPHGAAGVIHLFFDNYYQGYLVNRNGSWFPYLNENSVLSAEDCEVILEAVAKIISNCSKIFV